MSDIIAKAEWKNGYKDQPTTLDFDINIPISEILLCGKNSIQRIINVEGIRYDVYIHKLGKWDEIGPM